MIFTHSISSQTNIEISDETADGTGLVGGAVGKGKNIQFRDLA